jgi:hypothetical protein
MGLDKEFGECLNGYMTAKILLAKLGLTGENIGFKGLHSLLKGRKTRVAPHILERLKFENEVREQFKKLQEKGLSIPIFTL